MTSRLLLKPGLNRLALLDSLPRESIGAELGVFEGAFSDEILKRVKPEVLFLVDLFEGSVVSGDQNGENLRRRDMFEMYRHLHRRFATQSGVHIVKSESVKWLNAVKPGLLDFVYIDTTHDYETTSAELFFAARAVKPGGIIAGHDFSRAYPGVVQAVGEFIEARDLNAEIYDGDKLPSFAIHLPLLIENVNGEEVGRALLP